MFSFIDDMSTDPVRVSTDRTGAEVRIRWGATTVKLNITEAVDLIDALATELAALPEGRTRPVSTPTGYPVATLARDENRVRADAEIREAL